MDVSLNTLYLILCAAFVSATLGIEWVVGLVALDLVGRGIKRVLIARIA